jgi:hypothetical protein
MDCQCGMGCGLTVEITYKTRRRLYHPKCPNTAKRQYDRERQRALRMSASRGAVPPNRYQRATEGRTKQKICGTCYNLPHARLGPLCVECGCAACLD